MQQTRGSLRTTPIHISVPSIKICILLLKTAIQHVFPPPQARVALCLCSEHPSAAPPSQDLPLSATPLKTDGLSQRFIGSKRLQALMRKKKAGDCLLGDDFSLITGESVREGEHG